jgi:hypothetical protein
MDTAQIFIALAKVKPLEQYTTMEDVQHVLSVVGAPGEAREVKRAVVAKLFTSRSPQGHRTVDTLEWYGEY